MSVSDCDMSDAAVLKTRINIWDYQLLQTHDIQVADFDKARIAYHTLSKTTKAPTRAACPENFCYCSCSVRQPEYPENFWTAAALHHDSTCK